LHVESVAWIAERKDVLSAVFFMLTLGAYTRYARQPSLRRYVTMSILFALGLMSKPMLVTLPFVLLLLDYWPLQRIADLRTLPRLVLEKVPLLVLAAASSIATSLAQSTKLSTIQDLPISSRIGNALVSVCIYIGQMFWPANLAAFYPHPVDRLSTPMSIFSFIFIVVITIVALIVGRKHGYVPVGWFWYLGMLAPVLGLVQVGLQGRADRYTYLPHIGLYLLITWGIVDFSARWPYRRQILGAAAVVLVGVFMWRSQMQAKVWHDTETFWQHALAVTSRNHLAHAALGEIALSRHRLDEAILHLQTAVEIYPDNGQAYNSLGLALLQAGRSDAAVANWKIALEIEPHDLNTQSNLAWVFATSPEPSMRDGPRAVQLMEDVIQRSDRRNPIVLRTLAAAYAESGRFSEAIGTAQEALNLANAGGNSALARALQENIDDYKNKIPLRDPLLIKPPATR
jgi:cytochrome c-type biogenesis protein CcmH/NrfG